METKHIQKFNLRKVKNIITLMISEVNINKKECKNTEKKKCVDID